MQRRSSYKLTIFDKYGPAAVHYITAFKYGMSVLAVSFPAVYTIGDRLVQLTSPLALGLYTLNGSVTLGAASMLIGLKLGDTAGAGAQHVYMGGSSTPYQEQFSQEDALVMQRDYAGACHLYEQRLLATPTDVRVLTAAADLYGGLGENPKRAAELYKLAQKSPTLQVGQDIYVSNKLADLYLGKLKEPGRALVEFRRLMARYPGTVAEKNAKMALDNLKPDLVKGPDAN